MPVDRDSWLQPFEGNQKKRTPLLVRHRRAGMGIPSTVEIIAGHQVMKEDC